jgi:hypothetical protein
MSWIAKANQELNRESGRVLAEAARRTFQVLAVLLGSQMLLIVVFNHVVVRGFTLAPWNRTLWQLSGWIYFSLIGFFLYKAARSMLRRQWAPHPTYHRVGRKVVRILAWLFLAFHCLFAGLTLASNLLFRQTLSFATNQQQLRALIGTVLDTAIVAVVLWRTRDRGGAAIRQPR